MAEKYRGPRSANRVGKGLKARESATPAKQLDAAKPAGKRENRRISEIRGAEGSVRETLKSKQDVNTRQPAERVEAVMRGAANEGLTMAKDGRIAGRVSAELIAKAKSRTGLQSDTELVEFALASVALDDPFPQVFRNVKGTVDPDLDLDF